MTDLEKTARALVAPGRGILAADESFPTIEKRFKALAIQSTEENRRAYREMLFAAPDLERSISGVILFDETLRQRTGGGAQIPTFLAQRGIIPGIKVDKGTVALPNFPEEKFTQGLDGLRERLKEYREFGARFTKWRAVITVDDERPSATCLEANARGLALFAALSQEAGLVPFVEPEVLMDGNHTIERCEAVTEATLKTVFASLFAHRVRLEEMLLKTGMVLSGKSCPQQADDATIASATLRCLRRAVPAAVPGIVFLSGGQTPEQATQRLAAICAAGATPWTISFSYGRALQDQPLKLWKGSSANITAAQSALRERAIANSAALGGKSAA
jgi:fructose-bisphosphate aldolase class I